MNSLCGCSYTSAGGPTCSILPWLNTASRSDIVERLLLVVRHVDERDADLALDRLELDLHLLAELEVERAERLVEEQDLRAVHDRARERDALPLTAGQLGRLAVAESREPHHLSASAARSRRSPFLTFLTMSPYSTFSCTVMCGNSA